MEIIPAIDLLDGKCVRLHQGDYGKVTEFNSDPIDQALHWQEEGAKRLHLVDLDAAKTGNPINDRIISLIIDKLSIPVQVGGGIRSLKRSEELINLGAEKIILGTIAIDSPNTVRELAKIYPNKIIIGIDSKNGKVATSGWLKSSNIDSIELAKRYSDVSINSIITTDISKDGTLKGPNLHELENIAKASPFDVIASGGIGCMADLISLIPLEEIGVKGVILGRSLYDRKIDLREAIKVMEGGSLEDMPSRRDFLA